MRIDAAELAVWSELAEELHQHPVFCDCDFTTVEIVALKRNPEPSIGIDLKNPILRLERFVQNNGNHSIGKQELCKIMKISRPTLNRWIDDELISKGKTKEPWAGWQKFDLEFVIKELKKQKHTK